MRRERLETRAEIRITERVRAPVRREYTFLMNDQPPGGQATIPTTFVHVLVNTALANLTTNYLWFAVVFWVYLETRSVLATGILGGAYMLMIAACSMWFGSRIDRMKKHRDRRNLVLHGAHACG